MFEQSKPLERFIITRPIGPLQLRALYNDLFNEHTLLLQQYDSLFTHADSVEDRLLSCEYQRDHWYNIANKLFTINQHAVYGRLSKPGTPFIPIK